jgi:peptidoglycan/xylan/chitin deacetylase (PgdA/CDA1 family)
MTRFHIAALGAALVAASALAFRSLTLLMLSALALFVVMTLGAFIPRLSLFGRFICYGSCVKRRVALTFDDGPDEISTSAVLDFLRNQNLKAAFFCIGRRVTASPAVVARIAREGHLLGNHSYNHPNLINFFSVARLRDEMRQTQSAIRSAAGEAPAMYRPPMGLSNPRTFRAARAESLQVIGWTARGFDTRTKSPQRVVSRIARRLRPGAIILLHDGGIPAERLLATLQLLLDTLRSECYEVVRLDELLR